MRSAALLIVLLMINAKIMVNDPSIWGITNNSPWFTHFTYLFMHASWMHLICNSWFFLDMAFRGKTLTTSMWTMSIALAILMPAISSTPVVGISGLLYALSGFIFVYSRNKRFFIIIFSSMTVFQIILSNTAVFFHTACFISAIVLALIFLPVYNRRISDE